MTDNERETALWGEIRFRRKAIFRVWPEAKISTSRGGFFWDWGQEDAVLVTPREGALPCYDEELSLLQRELTKIWRVGNAPMKLSPDTQKVADMNQMVLLIVAAACDDEMWESDRVQDIHAMMMGKNPLDRIAGATGEQE